MPHDDQQSGGTPSHATPDLPALPVDPKFEELKRKSAAEKAADRRINRIGFWVGVIGLALAIPSFIYGYLGYKASQQFALLSYAVNPLKTEIQRPDFDQELGFTYKGKVLDAKNVTAIQVAVWNDGTKSIRADEVLKPFELVMPPGTRILSARVKIASRDVCEFQTTADEGIMNLGRVPLRWRILEPNDGATIQLIYVGGGDLNPTLVGTIEGQRSLKEVKFVLAEAENRRPVREETKAWSAIIAVGMGILGALFGFGTGKIGEVPFLTRIFKSRWSRIVTPAFVLLFLAFIAIMFALSQKQSLPLGW